MAGAADRELSGEIVEVTIVRHNKHSLQGELTEAARAAGSPRAPTAARPARRSLPLVPSAAGDV